MTAFVTTPIQFYCVRFFLGLAEGFFSGRHYLLNALVPKT